ncbi:hypothetical protein HYALB_00009228 [Hymenoscyphus albidus]|uniref:Uncharacterized protein n=1 Tax=Hymenoscyphus albidus TaxID=595503 RepID=A0A9N9Q1D8_9HELO|nr:hypothetical protein HYALB_00009228 [Hymenoscyphus albidus]
MAERRNHAIHHDVGWQRRPAVNEEAMVERLTSDCFQCSSFLRSISPGSSTPSGSLQDSRSSSLTEVSSALDRQAPACENDTTTGEVVGTGDEKSSADQLRWSYPLPRQMWWWGGLLIPPASLPSWATITLAHAAGTKKMNGTGVAAGKKAAVTKKK